MQKTQLQWVAIPREVPAAARGVPHRFYLVWWVGDEEDVAQVTYHRVLYGNREIQHPPHAREEVANGFSVSAAKRALTLMKPRFQTRRGTLLLALQMQLLVLDGMFAREARKAWTFVSI